VVDDADDDDPIKHLDSLGPLTSYEVLLMAQGRTLEQAKAEYVERTRINALADELEGKPIDQWPPFDIIWDTSPASFFYTLDGAENTPVDFTELQLIWVALADFDGILQPYNHRIVDEIWSVGDSKKAARALVHWSERRCMSPVWIIPTTAGKVGIVGGNHRLAIARAKGASVIPVLVEKKHLESIAALIKFLPGPERFASG